MLPGLRFLSWLAEAGNRFKSPISEWIIDWIVKGSTSILDALEPEGIDIVRPVLDQIRDRPETPDYLRNLIDRLLAGSQPLPLLVLVPIAFLLFIPTITSIVQPLGNLLRYWQERIFHSYRLDPLSIITAWRRDPERFAALFDDLRDQGWNEDRIEALKFFTQFLPTPQDLITWTAREVFEPGKREQYGLDDDKETLTRDLFYKLGFDDEQIDNYWAAHWEHSSFIQMVEMIRRGLLTGSREVPAPPATPAEWDNRDRQGLEQLYDWYSLVEIAPFWRNLLSEMVWEIPTRVDVRRWWDMRTISEEDLRSIYHRLGYHGEDLENYIRWTKVYTDFPSLITRWQKGWITREDVERELQVLGIPDERIQVFLQEKLDAEKPTRTESDRDLTVTDIYKGVKQERITRTQAIELLIDLGYDEDEAEYKLAVNVPEDEVDTAVQERQITKSDILAGLRTGVITEDEARQRLLELRYSAVDTQLLLDIFNASIKPPEEEKARQESKTDIISAVKKALITPEEGYLRLQDIGFTPEASEFILWVQAESSPFSPVSFGEFKDLTTRWKRATGREAAEMPEDLKQAGAELVRITREVESLEEAVKAEESNVIDVPEIPPEAEERLRDLRVTLNRARAEKQRLQGEYERRLAEWRQRER